MAGPSEILIVLGIFGLVGLYLYIVHRFIRESEQTTTASTSQAEASSAQPRPPRPRRANAPAGVSH